MPPFPKIFWGSGETSRWCKSQKFNMDTQIRSTFPVFLFVFQGVSFVDLWAMILWQVKRPYSVPLDRNKFDIIDKQLQISFQTPKKIFSLSFANNSIRMISNDNWQKNLSVSSVNVFFGPSFWCGEVAPVALATNTCKIMWVHDSTCYVRTLFSDGRKSHIRLILLCCMSYLRGGYICSPRHYPHAKHKMHLLPLKTVL